MPDDDPLIYIFFLQFPCHSNADMRIFCVLLRIAVPPHTCRRDYRSPFTRLGTSFADMDHGRQPAFVVHECGFMRYEDWNHRGIRSPYWRLHHNGAPGNALRAAGNTFPLEPRSVLITPPGVTFDTIGRRTVPHMWVHFTPAHEFALSLKTPLAIRVSGPIRPLLSACAKSCDAGGAAVDHRRLHHLCIALLHAVFAAMPAVHYHGYPPRILKILEHIARHPSTDLSNSRLATLAGLGLRSFEKWFKFHVDMSPAAYVSTTRIRLACRQLALSERPIDEIAESLGFPDRYYFSRAFKRHMGCGPATFRKGGGGREN